MLWSDKTTNGYGNIRSFAWSTDGNWLVLIRDDKRGTWLVRRDGTGLRRITHTNTADGKPAWLPAAH